MRAADDALDDATREMVDGLTATIDRLLAGPDGQTEPMKGFDLVSTTGRLLGAAGQVHR